MSFNGARRESRRRRRCLLEPGEPVVGPATGSLSRIRSSAVVVAGRIVSDSRRMSSPRWLISWLRAVERRIATTTGRRVALRSVRSISACRSCVRFVLVLDRQDCSCRRATGVEHLDPADVRGGADQETRKSLPPRPLRLPGRRRCRRVPESRRPALATLAGMAVVMSIHRPIRALGANSSTRRLRLRKLRFPQRCVGAAPGWSPRRWWSLGRGWRRP